MRGILKFCKLKLSDGGGENMIFVCSPYRGDVIRNAEKAQLYCQMVIKSGLIPIAPHLYFPQFLDDNDPAEREAGIRAGLELIKHCNEIWVFGKEITDGMRQEIEFARKLEKRIKYFDVIRR